jgi:hypothetical protein
MLYLQTQDDTCHHKYPSLITTHHPPLGALNPSRLIYIRLLVWLGIYLVSRCRCIPVRRCRGAFCGWGGFLLTTRTWVREFRERSVKEGMNSPRASTLTFNHPPLHSTATQLLARARFLNLISANASEASTRRPNYTLSPMLHRQRSIQREYSTLMVSSVHRVPSVYSVI